QIMETPSAVSASSANEETLSCKLEINYNTIVSDDEQTVTGKIVKWSESSQPYSIQFSSSDGTFNSEEILIKNGKFVLTLPTGKNSTQYWVYVKDNQGQLVESMPQSIQISRGIS